MEKISITRQANNTQDIQDLFSDFLPIVGKRYKSFIGHITVTFEEVLSTPRTEQKETDTTL